MSPEPENPALDLLDVYRQGMFPMSDAQDDPDIYLVRPHMRGILPLDAFHVPASLRKFMRKKPFHITVNTAFDDVIEACAGAGLKNREGTWINAEIMGWFKTLHREGYAHSVECRDANGALAGGLYGLEINGAFFGESMFSYASGASKVALVYLVERLRAHGFGLLDCQFTNPHLLQFGCIEIDSDAYQSRLEAALSLSPVPFAASLEVSASASSPSASVSSGVFLPA